MKENLNQLSFTDIYSNIDEYFNQDKPKLIKLFEQRMKISVFRWCGQKLTSQE